MQIVVFLLWTGCIDAKYEDKAPLHWQISELDLGSSHLLHSCIHDQILHQRRRPGRKEYSVTPQIYEGSSSLKSLHHKGRSLLEFSTPATLQKDAKHPIRIYLNYDAVGHSTDRDCHSVGDVVKVRPTIKYLLHIIDLAYSDDCIPLQLGEPPTTAVPRTPTCNPHGDPPIFGDCWYNCTMEDISGEDKKERLRKVLTFGPMHLYTLLIGFYVHVTNAKSQCCIVNQKEVQVWVSAFCFIVKPRC